jgi:hypothetical protein
MKKLLILFVLIFVCEAVQAQTLENSQRSIIEFLDEDGRFLNQENYNGSLDVSGFNFYKDKSGKPMFLPKSGGNPDNSYWTLESIQPGVNNSVNAIVVSGEDLYISGSFTTA